MRKLISVFKCEEDGMRGVVLLVEDVGCIEFQFFDEKSWRFKHPDDPGLAKEEPTFYLTLYYHGQTFDLEPIRNPIRCSPTNRLIMYNLLRTYRDEILAKKAMRGYRRLFRAYLKFERVDQEKILMAKLLPFIEDQRVDPLARRVAKLVEQALGAGLILDSQQEAVTDMAMDLLHLTDNQPLR